MLHLSDCTRNDRQTDRQTDKQTDRQTALTAWCPRFKSRASLQDLVATATRRDVLHARFFKKIFCVHSLQENPNVVTLQSH